MLFSFRYSGTNPKASAQPFVMNLFEHISCSKCAFPYLTLQPLNFSVERYGSWYCWTA